MITLSEILKEAAETLRPVCVFVAGASSRTNNFYAKVNETINNFRMKGLFFVHDPRVGYKPVSSRSASKRKLTKPNVFVRSIKTIRMLDIMDNRALFCVHNEEVLTEIDKAVLDCVIPEGYKSVLRFE